MVVDKNNQGSGWNTSPEFNPDNPSMMFDESVEILQDAKNGDVEGGNAGSSRWEFPITRDSNRYTIYHENLKTANP